MQVSPSALPGPITEPPVCVPSANGTMPAATATALPELTRGLRAIGTRRGVPGALARRFALTAKTCKVCHPGDAPPEPRYTPSRKLAEFVRCRDLTCRFPGCDAPPGHCDIHHCTPWHHGGDTATTNGTLVCRHHHTFLHERRWQVHLDHRQRPTFTKPDGTTHQLTSHRPRC